jgi:hypothetical protein
LTNKIYNLITVDDNSLNIYNEFNNISRQQIAYFILEGTSLVDYTDVKSEIATTPAYESTLKFITTNVIYTSEEDNTYINVYKPSRTGGVERPQRLKSRKFSSNDRDLETTLEETLQYIEDYVSTYRNNANEEEVCFISDYTIVEQQQEQPPTIKTFRLSDPELNVIDDDYLENRWIADLNKINADNASETQPLGILEEVQTSDIINIKTSNNIIENDNQSSTFSNSKFFSLYEGRRISQTDIVDTSVLELQKLISNINETNSLDNPTINNYLLSEFGISSEQLKETKLVYEFDKFTSGPFKQYTESIKNRVEEVLPNRVTTESLQVQVFNKLIGGSYYSTFNQILNLINEYRYYDSTKASSIKEDILVLPFERLLGINKTKNKMLQDYINNPCAITEDLPTSEDIPLINKYLIRSYIELLIKTYSLRIELKSLLSLTKINPYTYVENDDTYIEFLLQTIKFV